MSDNEAFCVEIHHHKCRICDYFLHPLMPIVGVMEKRRKTVTDQA
jgi:hypothetical protein